MAECTNKLYHSLGLYLPQKVRRYNLTAIKGIFKNRCENPPVHLCRKKYKNLDWLTHAAIAKIDCNGRRAVGSIPKFNSNENF